MAAASNESGSNRNTGARRTARKKMLKRILLKVGIGLLVHEGIPELDDLLGDASEAAQDALEQLGDRFADGDGSDESTY
ncbi:hypothetical protein [Streptomyces gibsoniae]|uniref:Uncharacterized protein n=1 Tax=Streptomyces gibsoniae TaxID=3075529 RepID=A0ABU2UB02_9ACTN|nr:hypothetical protein [Streptomyces sp. DSM 41699]MDT0470245.1 hypothetical protein [Streptomyces sp. DSM 41699]